MGDTRNIDFMRSLNRHYTQIWKRRRKYKPGDKCHKAKCPLCHYGKVSRMPNRKQMRENEIMKFLNQS